MWRNNETEFTNRAILKWASNNGVDWHLVNPGKPQQSAFIESLNSSLRGEFPNDETFDNPEDPRRKLAPDYNNVGLHSSVGN